MKKHFCLLVAFLYIITNIIVANNPDKLPIQNNEKHNVNNSESANYSNKLNARTAAKIETIINNAIQEQVFPGCQVLVMKDGKTIYDKSFGHFTYTSNQKVQPTTMYDLASLSKTTGTLLAVMKLYDSGKLKLTDKISQFLPFLKNTDKESLTIKDLLFHETGLPGSLSGYNLVLEKNNQNDTKGNTGSDNTNFIKPAGNTYKYKENLVSKTPTSDFALQVSDNFYLSNNYHELAMQKIANTRLRTKTYLYSCVNFILLKEIVENISHKPMDIFLVEEFYHPMQLNYLSYLPLRTHKKEEIAPTLQKDFLRNGVVQGYVHDPDAAFLGGVSGNAGIFANSHDVAQVYQMLLNNGELNGKRYLNSETCKLFTTMTSASGRRGLGFDKPIPNNPKYSPCSVSAPKSVYGHTGYTGTCCWVDPTNKLIYVFLSNRTYPNDGVNKLAKYGIRTNIQELIYQSIK